MQHALFPPDARMAKLNGPKKWVPYVLILTICMASIIKCGQICLHCEDLNRMASVKDCPKDVKECGECIQGMKSVTWDISCIPFDVKILENPKNATGTIGKSMILNCRNNHEADCEWLRQGSIIYTSQDQKHYRYISYKNGIPTKNCDLEIISYRMEDSGWWECHSFTDYVRARSSKAWLIPNGQVLILGHPLHAIAQTKKAVVLNCKFNLPVQCEWLHKGKPVRMKKRVYQYFQKTDNNKREDCSIQISSFKKKDTGEWQCRNVPTGKDPRVFSNKAVLYDGKAKSDKCNELGDKLILHCYMSQPGECSWQRNKSVVKIDGRYKYVVKNTNPKDATDCSIIIQNLLKMDAAEWQCGSNSNDAVDGKFENQARPCINTKGPPKKLQKGKISKRSISPLKNASLPITLPQVKHHPLSGNYNLGDNITLQCKFNKVIGECFWLRNEHNVVIAHRYQFTGGNNGQNTADCSITIQQFQQTDLGSWICGSVADDQHNGVLSKTSYLDAIDFDYSSDERNEEKPELRIVLIHKDENTETETGAWIPSDISTAFIYLSTAASVLAIIFVILLSISLFVWFTRFHQQHEVIPKTKNKYTAINNIESIMEEEMYKLDSQTKLLQD